MLSIKNRQLQFGVFRAMGMGKRSIMGILLSEQGLISLSSLIIGGLIGFVAAGLYVPLLQLSYSSFDQVLPLIIDVRFMDYAVLYGILGAMVLVGVAALGIYTARTDVSQILKLGED